MVTTNPFQQIDERLSDIEAKQLDVIILLRKLTNSAPTQDEEYLTRKQAAKFLKVTEETLLQWRKKEIIKARFFGRTVRFLRTDLLKLREVRDVEREKLHNSMRNI